MGNITPRDRAQFIGEQRWDMRHHVSPSQFNGTNHIFYKVSKLSMNYKTLICYLLFTKMSLAILRQGSQIKGDHCAQTGEDLRPL
jgi:hypothetical protein